MGWDGISDVLTSAVPLVTAITALVAAGTALVKAIKADRKLENGHIGQKVVEELDNPASEVSQRVVKKATAAAKKEVARNG